LKALEKLLAGVVRDGLHAKALDGIVQLLEPLDPRYLPDERGDED
jgi:hypothetical protein